MHEIIEIVSILTPVMLGYIAYLNRKLKAEVNAEAARVAVELKAEAARVAAVIGENVREQNRKLDVVAEKADAVHRAQNGVMDKLLTTVLKQNGSP